MTDIYFISKTLLLYFLWYNYSFVYSIIIMFSIGYAIDIILKLTLNWDSLSGFSMMLARTVPLEKKPTMTGYMILEDYNPEEWRNMIIKRGIDAFPKLRKVLTLFLGNYYWKDAPASLAYKNVKIINDVRLNSLKDICDYSIKEQAIYYNDNEIPYEFHFIRYGDKGGIIFVKFDHALSDGIGFLGFLMAMSDNYSVDLFPQMKEQSFFLKILILLLKPFYAIKNMISINKIKIKNSPMKRDTKIGKKRMYITKKYNFDKISKVYKPMGISFNDLMMCILSKNYKIYAKELETKLNTKYELDTFVTWMAVSLRSMPKKLKDFEIDNKVTGIFFELPAIDDIEKEKGKIVNPLGSILKNPFEIFGSEFAVLIGANLIPNFHIEKALIYTAKPIDIVTSNVPGPKKALYYSGSKVLSIMATPQQMTNFNALVIMTYDGEFSIAATSDENIEMDIEVLVKMMEKDIERYLI